MFHVTHGLTVKYDLFSDDPDTSIQFGEQPGLPSLQDIVAAVALLALTDLLEDNDASALEPPSGNRRKL